MASRPFLTGVTLWPAETGPHLWHRFDIERVRHDLASIRVRGFDTVRVLLGWDAFMPSDREVSPDRMAELEALLGAASELGLGVVPVLFVQSLADCVVLPAYTVDPGAPRRGVRVVAGGVVRAGGPRDLYTDPLMLELQARWLEALLGSFAGHPAVVAWDLGHDPASTVRPLHFDDLRRWAALMSEPLRAAGERCWLTLGAGDLLNARGVRLHLVAESVDALGLLVLPQTVDLGRPRLSREPVLFLAELAGRMARRDGLPITVTTGVAAGSPDVAGPGGAVVGSGWNQDGAGGTDGGREPVPARRSPDLELADPGDAAAHAGSLLAGLRRSGVAGALAWTWSCNAPGLMVAPPFDRFPSLAGFGLVEPGGDLTPAGTAWSEAAVQGLAAEAPAAWPTDLDEDDYYANLPESALDLFASWRRARSDQPGILD